MRLIAAKAEVPNEVNDMTVTAALFYEVLSTSMQGWIFLLLHACRYCDSHDHVIVFISASVFSFASIWELEVHFLVLYSLINN